ncbi:HipA domain-containing protein [Bacillus fonticola]|uniref:HipA domain-containing protein n=1 Tax=Bacillus fonticola TaxID=2728853 RepID=UPI001475EBB0|nr:HipA domain-containing protein [Bacillus fonticola]
MYEVIDISTWSQDLSIQASGTREKYWMQPSQERKEKFLFKIPRVKGEIWAEKVAAEIGKSIGLTMMNVSFATHNEREGVLLENFSPRGIEMHDGGEILSTIVEQFNPKQLDDYSIENIIKALNHFNLIGQFISVCVFDSLIANQDRHCENWAIMLVKGNYNFSPIYDNGASLGFNESEEVLREYLRDEVRFKAFTNRAKTLIEVNGNRKPKVKQLMDYLSVHFAKTVNREIDRTQSLDYNKLNTILDKVPDHLMSDIQRDWVVKLIAYRVDWLTYWRKELV